MSQEHYIVQGALCQCKFSEAPETDTLLVNTQDKVFLNDKEGTYKLAASTQDIGSTLEKNTFGNCTLQPNGSSYLPCQAVITEWTGFYEKKVLHHGGKVLLESSKAGCPVGGADCIIITDHGQQAEVTQQNLDNADDTVLMQLYPLGNLKKTIPPLPFKVLR